MNYLSQDKEGISVSWHLLFAAYINFHLSVYDFKIDDFESRNINIQNIVYNLFAIVKILDFMACIYASTLV